MDPVGSLRFPYNYLRLDWVRDIHQTKRKMTDLPLTTIAKDDDEEEISIDEAASPSVGYVSCLLGEHRAL